jgi:hypothetical protein
MGLAWLSDGAAHRRPNLVFAAAFALAMVALLFLDPPYAGRLAPVADRLSVIYAVFALLLLFLWLALALAPQSPGGWPARLAVAALGSALATAALWRLFPLLFKPESAVFGGELGPEFWGLIDEMRPAYRDLPTLLLVMTGPSIGLAAAVGFALARRGRERWAWAWCALALAALMIPGILHIRFALYPQTLAALPVAALLAALGPLAERISVPALRLPARALAIALIVVAPMIATGLATQARGGPKKNRRARRGRLFAARRGPGDERRGVHGRARPRRFHSPRPGAGDAVLDRPPRGGRALSPQRGRSQRRGGGDRGTRRRQDAGHLQAPGRQLRSGLRPQTQGRRAGRSGAAFLPIGARRSAGLACAQALARWN